MVKELLEKRNALVDEMETMINKAKEEKRALEDIESTKFEEIKTEIAKIDKTINAEEEIRKMEVKKPMDKKEEKRNIVDQLMNGSTIDLSKEEVRAEQRDGEMISTVTGMITTSFADSILQKLVYVSDLYAKANKIVTSQPHQIPLQATKIGKFVKTAELGNYVNQAATFATKTLNAVKYTNMFTISKELLEDSTYNVESELISQTVEALGTTLDELIVKGSAVDSIDGLELFTTGAGAKEAVCSTVKSIVMADIMKVFYTLPIQYRKNAVWIFNDKTAALLSDMKDANGAPLLFTSYQNGPVNGQTTLLGRPVIINNNVADYDSATAARAMYFVDLQKALTIGVRKGLEMVKSTEYGFLNDSVAVKSSIRLDIKTMIEESLCYLKTKIS